MTTHIFRWLPGLLLCITANSAFALQINRTSSTNIYTDFVNSMACNYASYQITNNDGVAHSNLWVTIDSFSGSIVKLGGGDSGQYNLGKLAVNESKTVFFYLQATNTTSIPQSHNINIYRGYPDGGGVLLTNQNFSVRVVDINRNNANKITAVSYAPAQPVIGSTITIVVDGATSQLTAGDGMAFTPAAATNWNATAFELVSVVVTLTNSGTISFTNTLFFGRPAGGGNNVSVAYRAEYVLRAVAATATNTPLSPDGCFANGNPATLSHSLITAASIPTILPPTNTTILTMQAAAAQIYTNETAAFIVTFTNSGSQEVSFDRARNTLPPNFTYVPNSSTFGGSSVADPAIAGQILTWSEGYVIPPNSSRSLVFQAVATVAGYATNSAVAFTKDTQLDTTLVTTDNAPATTVVRVLLEPTAVNDTHSTLEDIILNVPAPGVLANDAEPNTFNVSVISYTQPTNGSVVVNANGSYTYTPAADDNGPDSFTYTMTNGNARASTATVNLTVTAVNDAPSFTKGADPTVLEDSAAQTIENWAANISPGPANESGQTVTFRVSNNNSNLFSVQPEISSTGALTFTPAANAGGTATVSVYLQDNGGTDNGGSDSSATETFSITLTGVNDAPGFTKGADETVLEDAGAQTVANWATDISPGPADESGQIVTFHVSNNNSNLFAVQPAISANGTLSYTPAPDANGSATVTVYLQDDGGTADGATDVSATETFTITVTAVNDAPTVDAISPIDVDEDAPEQTVSLTGITAGPADEAGQTLTVTAASSDPGLIPHPTVTYSSPDTTGSLSFTPAATATGVVTITIIISDNGGVADGGANAVTNIFTVTVNALTTVWEPDGNLTRNVTDAAGAPGLGYERLQITGNLDIQATSENPFTIRLASQDDGLPGPATNFDYDIAFTWTMATTTRGVDGFDPNKFVFDTSAFTNDLAGGIFSAALSEDGKSVNVVFTPNQGPVANPINYSRTHGTVLRVPIQNLLTSNTSDPDGDARVLVTTGTSTNGSYIGTNNTHVIFAPTNNISESFIYVVKDARAYRMGDTVRMATNWFTVTVTNAVGVARSITVSGETATVRFAGVPGYAYAVERATNIANPAWTVIWTTNAPPTGAWQFVDTNPPPAGAFYRTRQH